MPYKRKSKRFVWEHVLHWERLSYKMSKMSLLFSSLINEELTPRIAFFHLKDIIPVCVCVCVCVCRGGRLIAKSCLTLFITLWLIAHKDPLSMGFPKQEYWNGLPFPSPEDLPNPGSESVFSTWQADFLPLSHLGRPYSFLLLIYIILSSFIIVQQCNNCYYTVKVK